MRDGHDDPGQVACWVLGQLWNPSGRFHPGGDFTQQLINAVKMADPSNMNRLRHAFPIVVWAVDSYQQLESGVDLLEHVAGAWLDQQQREEASRCTTPGG